MSKSKTGSRATTKSTGVATRKQYFGETDPAQFIWQNKTHRTASEAFRDADYATPIWRCENEWDRTKEHLIWIVLWAFLLFALYSMAVVFERIVP